MEPPNPNGMIAASTGSCDHAGWTIEQLTYVNAFLFPPIAFVRLLQRLVPRGPRGEDREMSGFFIPPLGFNRVLEWLLASEGSLMSWGNLPVGVGLLCRARRDVAPDAGAS